MSFDLERTFESKRAYRQALAARPVVEKLRLLDELRARALVIRHASTAARPHGVVMYTARASRDVVVPWHQAVVR